MYFGLTNDSWKKFDSEESLLKNKSKFKYCIIDIGNDLKGPLECIVKSSDMYSLPPRVSMAVSYSYSNIFIPFNEAAVCSCDYEIDSYSLLYGILSNVYQYELFNYYTQDHIDDTCDDVSVYDIRLNVQDKTKDKSEELHYFYNIPCTFLDTFLKKKHLQLSTNKVLKTKTLYLYKNGSYEIAHTSSRKDIKYIGIPFIKGECFYMLSFSQYTRLMQVSGFEIQIGLADLDPVTDTLQLSHKGRFEATTFYSLLEAFLFVPQYCRLHTALFKDKITVVIDAIINGVSYSIVATPDELVDGIPLFKLINNLTKI